MRSVRVFLQGGLGNQLFTYFAAANYAEKNKVNLILDTSELPFGISYRGMELSKLKLPHPYEVSGFEFIKYAPAVKFLIRLRRVFLRNFPILIHDSKVVGYDQSLEGKRRTLFIRGYFQSWKYFQSYKNVNLDTDVKPLNPSVGYIKCADLMQLENPICIHVRRGDYLRLGNEFGYLSEEYFEKSLLQLENPSRPLWLFSDDPDLVIRDFRNIKFDLIPTVEFSLDDAESLIIMSLSNTVIMSNSSFSWWAATLGNQEKEVLAPFPWFKSMENPEDLYFPNWKKVGSEWG